MEAFREAMDDVSIHRMPFLSLFEMAREINKLKTEDAEKSQWDLAARLRELAGNLGLLQQDQKNSYKLALTMMKSQRIGALIQTTQQSSCC